MTRRSSEGRTSSHHQQSISNFFVIKKIINRLAHHDFILFQMRRGQVITGSPLLHMQTVHFEDGSSLSVGGQLCGETQS